jgi:NitT/TauT family transport system ATP-binding protein
VLAFDKRRIDPHAPHRFGATAVYDIELTRKTRAAPPEIPEEVLRLTESVITNTQDSL